MESGQGVCPIQAGAVVNRYIHSILLSALLLTSACQNKDRRAELPSAVTPVSTASSSSSVVIPNPPVGIVRTSPPTESSIIAKPTFRVNFASLPGPGYQVHLYRISCHPMYRLATVIPNQFATSTLITPVNSLAVTASPEKFFANIEFGGKFSTCSTAYALYRRLTSVDVDASSGEAFQIKVQDGADMNAIDSSSGSLWDATEKKEILMTLLDWLIPSASAMVPSTEQTSSDQTSSDQPQEKKPQKRTGHQVYDRDQLQGALKKKVDPDLYQSLVQIYGEYQKALTLNPEAKLPEEFQQKIKFVFKSKSNEESSLYLSYTQLFANDAAVITDGKIAYYGSLLMKKTKYTGDFDLKFRNLKNSSVIAEGKLLRIVGGRDVQGRWNRKHTIIELNDEKKSFTLKTIALLPHEPQKGLDHFKFVPVDQALASILKLSPDEVAGKCALVVALNKNKEIINSRLKKLPNLNTTCGKVDVLCSEFLHYFPGAVCPK